MFKLIKLVCTAQQTISKTKRQPAEQEKIFANDLTHEGLIANIYKQPVPLNIKKQMSIPIKRGRTESTLFQTGKANDQQAHEKMISTANHQGNANQNHNEVSPYTCQNGCHQNEHVINVGQDAEKREPFYTRWEYKLVQWRLLGKLKLQLPPGLEIPPLGIYSKRKKTPLI